MRRECSNNIKNVNNIIEFKREDGPDRVKEFIEAIKTSKTLVGEGSKKCEYVEWRKGDTW